ncbi:MAG: glycosyltransferase family 39 protein, partial [Sedimentisphaerales bacterium]|nr:glycosyltransferase family 39 protein [Sedimentisphaerales bacterium]
VLIIILRRRLISVHRRLAADSEYSIMHLHIIFWLSLGVRLFVLPWAINLSMAGDEEYYWLAQDKLLAGDFTYVIFRPPLWSCLLTIPSVVMHHPFMARAFTTLIGACAPVLLYFLAVRVFNKRTALVAALIYALYPVHIGYSHYLWAEILFGCLCLISVYSFLIYTRNTDKTKYYLLAFFMAGIALLTKESGAILFAGLAVALLFLKTKNRFRKLMAGGLLFLVPAFAYSIVASCITNRVVVLSDAPVVNFRMAAGLFKADYSFETQNNQALELTEFVAHRSMSETIHVMKEHFYNLWTPNSFPINRLLNGQSLHTWRKYLPKKRGVLLWGYDNSMHWPLAYFIAGSYIVIILLGLVGLCLADTSPFKVFSIVCLLCLSLSCVVVFLCSRFRFPFMFIFIMYSAHLLMNGKTLLCRLKSPKRIILLLILLTLFAHIVYTKVPTFGSWG